PGEMPAVRIDGVRRIVAQRDAWRAARTVLRRLDRAPFPAWMDFRCRAGAGQPDNRGWRRDIAVHELRVIGTIGVDARRLRRRVRTDAAGWHRRAIPAGPLPAAEVETVPLSRSASSH